MTQANQLVAKQPKIVNDDDERFNTLDSSSAGAERSRLKTPSALRQAWDRDKKRCRPSSFEISKAAKQFKEWARVDVAGQLTDDGLHLEIEVTCNPAYMCEPHDLVPVYLEQHTDQFVFMIALLEPTVDENFYTINVTYPLRELVSALGLTPKGDKAALRNMLRDQVCELGVTAQWLAETTEGNGPNHCSGGVFEKGGSGKILLKERSREDFVASETVRNTEWNMAERLTADRARPVYAEFKEILAPGKEMATTLEAESEYEVGREDLEGIIEKMDALMVDVIEAERTGAKRPFDIASMTKSVKVYTDQYFDLVVPDDKVVYPLLANRIVLRRRMVDSDPEGTYLFTLKGRGVVHNGERLRLAAQVNLIEDMMSTDKGMRTLRAFLLDRKNPDNAFARVLRDALEDREITELLAGEWMVQPSVLVESDRTKYGMKFDDGTVIEFSADSAACKHDGNAHKVYSFELGVGHPGLTAGGTATAISMASRIAQFDSVGGKVPTPQGGFDSTASPRKITRPYHVPKDLNNSRLVQKGDFKKYLRLRDALITQLFGLKKGDLKLGGNKATVLAEALGLVKKG